MVIKNQGDQWEISYTQIWFFSKSKGLLEFSLPSSSVVNFHYGFLIDTNIICSDFLFRNLHKNSSSGYSVSFTQFPYRVWSFSNNLVSPELVICSQTSNMVQALVYLFSLVLLPFRCWIFWFDILLVSLSGEGELRWSVPFRVGNFKIVGNMIIQHTLTPFLSFSFFHL